MKKQRKQRAPKKGEFVCRCSAYKFPHRFSGGKCSGKFIVRKQWSSSYGFFGDCLHCSCKSNYSDSTPYCEVLEGGEQNKECPVFQEFVDYNEIIIYGKRE